MKYKFLEHTADIKFQAYGKTKEEAFANAALALTNVFTHKKVKPVEVRMLEAEGSDDKQLLYAWLEKVLLQMQIEHFLVAEVSEITISANKLHATVKGDNSLAYELDEDVKAITYHEMEMSEGRKWVLQVVIDI